MLLSVDEPQLPPEKQEEEKKVDDKKPEERQVEESQVYVVREESLTSKTSPEQVDLLHETALQHLGRGLYYNAATYLERALQISVSNLLKTEPRDSKVRPILEKFAKDCNLDPVTEDCGNHEKEAKENQKFAENAGGQSSSSKEAESCSEPPKAILPKECAQSAFILGMVFLQNLSDFKGALMPMRLALDLRAELLGPKDLSTVVTRKVTGQLYSQVDMVDEAILMLQEVADITYELLGEEHEQTGNVFFELGRVMIKSETNIQKGINYLSKALKIEKSLREEDEPEGLQVLKIVGLILGAIGNAKKTVNNEKLKFHLEKDHGNLEIVSEKICGIESEILQQKAEVARRAPRPSECALGIPPTQMAMRG